MAIVDIKLEELENGNSLTLEKINEKLPIRLETTTNIQEDKIVGVYEGYDYEINSNFEVIIKEEIKGITITYALSNRAYTKENIYLTITAKSTEVKIISITAPVGIMQDEDGAYIITENGNYEFTVEDEKKNTKTESIIINQIDKLPPKDLTIEVRDVKAKEFKIMAITEDAEEDGKNAKSGVEKYKCYIRKKGTSDAYTEYEAKDGIFHIMNLEPETNYEYYVVALDKAQNSKQTALTDQQTDVATTEVYIEVNRGNDETGNGTKEKPYRTLEKIADAGIVSTGIKYEIHLGDGEYDLTNSIFNLNCNKSISIFGNKQNTILNCQVRSVRHSYPISFGRLVWREEGRGGGDYIISTGTLNFYNVAFDFKQNPGWAGYDFVQGTYNSHTYVHCILMPYINTYFRVQHQCVLNVYASYGGFGFHRSEFFYM